MKKVLFLLLLLLSAASYAGPSEDYENARTLYQEGQYVRASQIFASLADYADAEGYKALCALKLRSEGSERLVASLSPACGIAPLVYFEYGLKLFDEGRYAEACDAFDRFAPEKLDGRLRSEYLFRRGYCDYALGRYPEAREWFLRLEKMPASGFTAPARYALGYTSYVSRDFPEAAKWFELSAKDSRFAELSAFYLIECKFGSKDYEYVVEKGEKMFPTIPEERRPRLSRLISEAYLVKGNLVKAQEYFADSGDSSSPKSRSDLFYAGSLMYAVGDFKAAVQNFSRMEDFSDSLGQTASYELGYSYIQTRNKVSALESFRKAASLDFNPSIKEDAFFNWAKLAFDLGGDTSVFKEYIRKYAVGSKGSQIYDYMALAALKDRDYASAIEYYDQIEELSAPQRSNYTKANFLRGSQLMGSGSFRDAVAYFKAAAYYAPRRSSVGMLSRYYSAECSFRSGSLRDAQSVWQDLYNLSALDSEPEGRSLPYNIGYCCLKNSKWKDAALWMDRYIESGAAEFREDALTRRADCDFVEGRYKEAAAGYSRVVGEFGSPENVYPYLREGLSYGLCGNRREKIRALSLVRRSSASAPLRAEAYYELARAEVDAGMTSEAEADFRTILAGGSSREYEARALVGVAMLKRNAGALEEALALYKKVVSDYPDASISADAMPAIESIYQSLSRPQDYIAYAEAEGSLSSKSPEERERVYYSAIEQLYCASKWEETLSAAEKFLSNFPSSPKRADALFYKAEGLRQKSALEEACALYSEAVTSPSFGVSALSQYAALSYRLERYQDALGAYRRLADTTGIAEIRSEAFLGVMKSGYAAREYASALEACDSVLVREPSSRAAKYVKAKSLLATSRREEAFVLISELASDPFTPEGAEARYITIKDLSDRGDFQAVAPAVYEFAQCGTQEVYWLAKCYIILADSFVELGASAQARATLESIRDGYEPSGSSDDVLPEVESRLKKLVGNE